MERERAIDIGCSGRELDAVYCARYLDEGGCDVAEPAAGHEEEKEAEEEAQA